MRFAFPRPHANTVTPPSLTSVAASMDVCRSDLPGAASTDCSPSEMNSTNLDTPWRPPSKSCPAASNPSEIEVLPYAVISSMPALMLAYSYDHDTRIVASDAKDTTEKRAAFTPSANWFTSSLAKALSPPGPSIEPSGVGFFIEPLSSSTRMKSIRVAQAGLGDGGGGDGAASRRRRGGEGRPRGRAGGSTSRPNSLALAMPAQFSTQKPMSHLSSRGRGTCGAGHMLERCRVLGGGRAAVKASGCWCLKVAPERGDPR